MEKDIIYIAGNPNAYPIEYYDGDAQAYRGVIPELMDRFSEQSRYEVRYYSPGERDQREALAANQQVDIISCPEDPAAVRHRAGEDIVLLEDGGDGQAAVLCLLDAAPDGLAEDLRAFLSGISQRELTGLVVQAARDNPPQNRRLVQGVMAGLALAAALLSAALAAVMISHRRRLRRLRQERERDPVTGIGNREYLERRGQACLNDRNRILYTMFCFCFDPSAAAGGEDEAAIPRHMACVLQNSASDTDILARVSDDGFALLRLSLGERDSADWLAAVLGRIRESWEGGGALRVTAGAYPLRAGDRDWNEILFRGLRTAQSARQQGLDYQFFSDDTLREIQEEHRLRADAPSGLQNREFQLYLRFYVDAQTGRAAGAEVLLLWDHPERGLLPEARWRSLLEQEGLAGRLDCYVLERMCDFLSSLQQNGREDFFLLYRLSGEALSNGPPEGWADILEDCRFPRRQMLFGVPQDAVPQDGGIADGGGAGFIQAMGMGLVLDGFDGQMTGLARAGNARFCGVKLSGGLTGQAETPAGRMVLESILRTGRGLELAFLAGGVDTEERAERLRELGCDLLCGELYAHPLPAWEAMKKLVRGKEETDA